MKKIAALVMAMLMVTCLFAGCAKKEAANDDLSYVKDKGTLVIGITEYAPMNYYDDSGKLIGFDTEFAEAVCEKLGCTVEWYAAERQVVIAKGDSLRTITLDAANMTTLRIIPIVSEDNAMAVNKTVTELTPAPTLIGDLTYVPVAFFEAMGLTVSSAN